MSMYYYVNIIVRVCWNCKVDGRVDNTSVGNQSDPQKI